MEDLIKTIAEGLNDAYTRLWHLKSIKYMDIGGIVTLEEGVTVRINGETFENVDNENPTHIITECRGRINDTGFEISVMDLTDRSLKTIKL